MPHSVQTQVNKQALSIETGKVAKQADGAVVVRCGGTVVLSTVVAAKSPMEGRDRDFLPLTVEYRERAYAGGRIPGGFFKREGRPDEKETLTCRLIDRPLRPLFPKSFRNEIQIINLVISADDENDPDMLALVGSSAAMALSGIPFSAPDRRGAGGPGRRQARGQPDLQAARRLSARDRHRGHGGRGPHGRVRRAARSARSRCSRRSPSATSSASRSHASRRSSRPRRASPAGPSTPRRAPIPRSKHA